MAGWTRWLKHGAGLLFARPGLWPSLALLKLMGGQVAAVAGVLLLPAALLPGGLPVLCAFAASRDPGVS